MTIDPKLQALFEQAKQDFDREAFAHDVMMRIDRERRSTVFLWLSIGIAAVIALVLLAAPLFAAFGMASQFLPTSLIEMEAGLLQQLLSPVNSIAAAIAIGVLGLWKFYRSIFG